MFSQLPWCHQQECSHFTQLCLFPQNQHIGGRRVPGTARPTGTEYQWGVSPCVPNHQPSRLQQRDTGQRHLPAEALHISLLHWLHQTDLFSRRWQHLRSWIGRLDHWMGNRQQRRWPEPLLFPLAAVETGRLGPRLTAVTDSSTDQSSQSRCNKRLLLHSKHAVLWKCSLLWAPFCYKQQNFYDPSCPNKSFPKPRYSWSCSLLCHVNPHISVHPRRLLLPKPGKSVFLPLILFLVSSSWWLWQKNGL